MRENLSPDFDFYTRLKRAKKRYRDSLEINYIFFFPHKLEQTTTLFDIIEYYITRATLRTRSKFRIENLILGLCAIS